MEPQSKYTLEPADIEKGRRSSAFGSALGFQTAAAVPANAFTEGNTLYAKLQRFAGRFNIEQRGIERVPEAERTDRHLMNIGTMVSLFLYIYLLDLHYITLHY